MNELYFFYKEAGFLEEAVNWMKGLAGITNPIEYTSQGDHDAAAYVKQESKVDKDGNVMEYEIPDNKVYIRLDDFKNEFQNILSEFPNLTKESVEEAYQALNNLDLTKLDIKNIAENPEELNSLVNKLNISANATPILTRIMELLYHEVFGHLDTKPGEQMKGEDYAESKEKEGKQKLLDYLKSKYQNLDKNIKEFQSLLDKLNNMGLSKAMAANDQEIANNQQINSAYASIINGDISKLTKIANALDSHGYVIEADLIDLIIESELN